MRISELSIDMRVSLTLQPAMDDRMDSVRSQWARFSRPAAKRHIHQDRTLSDVVGAQCRFIFERM